MILILSILVLIRLEIINCQFNTTLELPDVVDFNQSFSVFVYNHPKNISAIQFGDKTQPFLGGYNCLYKNNQKFILLASKEVEQDGELESIEFAYGENYLYSISFVSFRECGIAPNNISCKEYLKTNKYNLTISNRIYLPNQLKISTGKNFFQKSQFTNSSTTPFIVEKGYVPVLEILPSDLTYTRISSINDTNSPDYICLNNGSIFMNIEELSCQNNNIVFKNVLIDFEYTIPNLNLSDYTFNYSINLFGSFAYYVFTRFGGNILNSERKVLTVQTIKTYPFQNIQLNIFELNCSLIGKSLECFLTVNISNYGNSFQQVSIDYGNGTNDLIQFNPYYVPLSVASDYMSSAAFSYTGIILFNNFIQIDSSLKAIELFSNGDGRFYFALYKISSTFCNSTETCSKYIEDKKGKNVSFMGSSLTSIVSFTVKRGFNLLNLSELGKTINATKNSIPVLRWADSSFRLSIDTSNGSKYSDYFFNSFDFYYDTIDLKRINLNLNWRYYFRIYYEKENYISNQIKFKKNYSSVLNQNEFNVSALLNLDNGTRSYATSLVKTQLVPETTKQNYLTNVNFPNISNSANCTDSFQTSFPPFLTASAFSNTIPSFLTPSATVASNESSSYVLKNLFFNQNTVQQLNLTELVDLLENKTFQFELKLDSFLPTSLLESDLDINNCISNCSNHGICRLNKYQNQFECLCESDFDGIKCDIDKRQCSYYPCLNSIKCQDIILTSNLTMEYDFKCVCKSNLFYGKRCENKVNICQNETCSGNGICKEKNETKICECFGKNDFEGEKCEIKSSRTIVRETAIKTTAFVAISIVLSFYILLILMDVHKLITTR